jgi:hypothetical protein
MKAQSSILAPRIRFAHEDMCGGKHVMARPSWWTIDWEIA